MTDLRSVFIPPDPFYIPPIIEIIEIGIFFLTTEEDEQLTDESGILIEYT